MGDEENSNEIENITNNEIENQSESEDVHKSLTKHVIERHVRMFGEGMPFPNPLLEKMNEEHITKLLQQKEDDSKRNFNKLIIDRITLVIFLIVFVILIIFFTKTLATTNPNLYSKIIEYVLVSGISGLGGYGLGLKKGQRSDEIE